jgi:methionyl-tRNA formyltransferase
MSVLLLSKTAEHCKAAQRFLTAHVADVTIVEGEHGDPLPRELATWHGDYMIAFLAPWIVPADTLGRASKAAINFHPAPPEYPGIGCYNFAIYDGATTYGVTCHHMSPRVDSGPIVRVLRFPLLRGDSVALLKERSMAYLLTLFYDIATLVAHDAPLPGSPEVWTRRPYTRRELDALCRLSPDMDAAEIERRVRATTFPGKPGPYMDVTARETGDSAVRTAG